MPFDVKLLLPSNLSNDYLKGEFIDQGKAYISNKFDNDPILDLNRNTLVFSFELRDSTTRELVDLIRIKELTLSNDPEFDESTLVRIVNLPESPLEFDSTYNYSYYLNPAFFFDKTQAQEITPRLAPSAGTGLFYIYNWPLSASGGLSRVYMKAVVEGPGGVTAEYPLGYGLYDEVIWQGEMPTSPSSPSYASLKIGWVGKDSLISFVPGSDSASALSTNGVSNYLTSLITVSSTGSSLDARTTSASTKRTLFANSSIGSSTVSTYKFYRDATNNYSSFSFSAGSNIGLTSLNFSRGAFFYTNTKFPYNSSKKDIYTQAAFDYSVSGIGVTSQAFMKIYDQPDTSANSKEIVLRVDIPNDSYPTAYLYTITNNTESVSKQTTTLPPNILPLLKSGGIMEMYYSVLDSSYSYVEAYFTPYIDQTTTAKKSYLLANSIVSSLGNTSLGSAFGYQILSGTGVTGSIKLDELVIANGSSILSADIGDCSNKDNNNINYPITKITSNWSLYPDDEFKIISEYPSGLSITSSVQTSYIELSKLDSVSEYDAPATYEVQLLKPSMSNRAKVDVTVLHRADDFYVAFSGTSSYRPHTQSGLSVLWDRPLGTRVDEDYAFSDESIDAPTVIVKFSYTDKNISILQRNFDNTFTKHVLKTYLPSATNDSYSIEITDQSPDGLNGTKKRKPANATWIYLKKVNGANLELVGYAQLNMKINSNSSGLGYYCAVGFKESEFNNGTNRLSQLSYYGLPKFYNTTFDNNEKLSTFLVSDYGISNSKHYLGIKQISSLTDLIGYNYSTPVNGFSEIPVEAVTTGSNVDVSNLNSLTIDGVVISSLSNGKYILIKDQLNTSENGIYLKSSGSWVFYNIAYNIPFIAMNGAININTIWYKAQIEIENTLVDKYICTTFFKDITIGEISPFVSTIVPSLLEFKLLWAKYDTKFPYDKLRIRFFSSSNDYPATALTDWLTISRKPLVSGLSAAPNNTLIQLPLDPSILTSLTVSQGTKIWVAVSIPFGSSLAEAYGIQYNNSAYFTTGSYSGYMLARNLWHKLFARRSEKYLNPRHSDIQQFRVRSLSHANVSSHSTTLSPEVKVDINGPKYNNDLPQIVSQPNTSLRTAVISILASDDDSGIYSFRVGREIDNSSVEYTPWLSWTEFVVNSNGLYSVYLHGHLNYYDSGLADSVFTSQNIGYSGPRKVWVQVMDYAGNVSESYPLTFVANSWMLVDTMPPSGTVEFYNPERMSVVNVTNGSNIVGAGSTNITSWIKIDATDTVSGVKDYKVRRIYDSGPGPWSNFEYYNAYRPIDFTGEEDGVKRVEVAFRDFGNNIVQPETSWKKVTRPNK
jgi:hypothetical protein